MPDKKDSIIEAERFVVRKGAPMHAWLLGLWLVAGGQQPPINCESGPLSLEAFMKLVPDVAPARIRAYIDRCMLGFAVNEAFRQRLVSAKVPPDLIV